MCCRKGECSQLENSSDDDDVEIGYSTAVAATGAITEFQCTVASSKGWGMDFASSSWMRYQNGSNIALKHTQRSTNQTAILLHEAVDHY